MAKWPLSKALNLCSFIWADSRPATKLWLHRAAPTGRLCGRLKSTGAFCWAHSLPSYRSFMPRVMTAEAWGAVFRMSMDPFICLSLSCDCLRGIYYTRRDHSRGFKHERVDLRGQRAKVMAAVTLFSSCSFDMSISGIASNLAEMSTKTKRSNDTNLFFKCQRFLKIIWNRENCPPFHLNVNDYKNRGFENNVPISVNVIS